MAEREGFEPSIRFPVYTLSKRAPSATRPSLLNHLRSVTWVRSYHSAKIEGTAHRDANRLLLRYYVSTAEGRRKQRCVKLADSDNADCSQLQRLPDDQRMSPLCCPDRGGETKTEDSASSVPVIE